MKTKYGTARTVADIIAFFGWLDIIGAVIVFVLSMTSSSGSSTILTVVIIPAFIAVAMGMFMIASGQVIKAIVDMADNSFIMLGNDAVKEEK